MTKAELIAAMAGKVGISKSVAEKAVNETFELISGAVAKGDKVALIGFGTFSVSERAAREGINPLTRKPIKIAAKKVPKFTAGKSFKDAVAAGKKK
jgi:DNA-binding protein HU-beta